MANEIQDIIFRSEADPLLQSLLIGGNITPEFNGETHTGSIDYNATAAGVLTVLEGMAAFASGDLNVTDRLNGVSQKIGWRVEFQGAYANTPVPEFTFPSNTLRKNADTISVNIVDYGSNPAYEVQRVSLGGATTGTFDLTDGGTPQTVSTLDTAGIQAAYDAIFGSGVATVADMGGGDFDATFATTGNKANLSVANNSTDGSPAASVQTEGTSGTSWQVEVWLPDEPDDGNLNLTVDGGTPTSNFAWNASSGTISSALSTVGVHLTADSGAGTTASKWVLTGPAELLTSFTAAEGSFALTGSCAVEVVTVQEGSYALTADSVSSGTPTVGEPTVAEAGGAHNLTATSVSSGTPSVGLPVIGQKHALTATGAASGTPSVGTPALVQVVALTANSVSSGTPSVGNPAIGQIHALTANSVSSGTPTVGSPAIGGDVALTANSVVSGTPTVGSPTLGQIHALAANSVSSGSPSVGSPAIGQIHGLAAGGVSSGTPIVGSPVFGQLHAMVAMAVASGAPSVGSPVLVVVFPSMSGYALAQLAGRIGGIAYADGRLGAAKQTAGRLGAIEHADGRHGAAKQRTGRQGAIE